MSVIFVSAAYGLFYREKAVRGLCNSFSKNTPEGTLIIFFDEIPSWEPPAGCYFRLLPEGVSRMLLEGDNSFFSRTCVKYDLMAVINEEYSLGVCWIDADTLVLSNLINLIDSSKINVISHGSCNASEEFDCGLGVIVKGKEFAIGGMFYLPESEIIKELIELVKERGNWPADEKAYWYSDGEQSLLNHVVQKYIDRTVWLDDFSLIVNWSFLKDNRHPYPFDKGLRGITLYEGKFYAENKCFAIIPWSSLTLRRHVKHGFRSLDSKIAKVFRAEFYNIPNTLKENIMQRLYTIYDYFYLNYFKK